jgi:hypothetical protein
MAGLLNFFEGMDKKTQMGLLMAGAQMMQTQRGDSPFAAIGNGLLGFANGMLNQEQQAKEDARLARTDARQSRLDDVDMQLKQAQAQRYLTDGTKQPDPYYTPIPTPNGVYGFDNRSGKVQLAIDESGQPVIKSSDSIPLQSGLAGAKRAAENSNSFVELDNSDGSKSKMLGGAAFPELLRQPTDLSRLPQVNGNNYGNIRPIGANKGFQRFDTPEAGLAAIDQNLAAYGSKHGINTLGGVISRWSPPNENDTKSLIANAARVTGLDPNQPIDLSDPKIRAMITPAIVKQEHSIDITNPITKPAVLGMQMAAKNGVSPQEAIDKGVAIAEQSVSDLKRVQGAAHTMYRGQTTYNKQAAEEQAKLDYEPKITAAKKESEIKAESKANAEISLPQSNSDAASILDTISKLEAHKGLDKGTGASSVFFNKVPGTDAYDFKSLHEQATGKVFMQAFQSLKGAGAITDKEGEVATKAISRMADLKQSKESYLGALNDLKSVVSGTLQRKQAMAGTPQPAPQSQKLSGDALVNFYLNGGK